jgi:hypothetical protein
MTRSSPTVFSVRTQRFQIMVITVAELIKDNVLSPSCVPPALKRVENASATFFELFDSHDKDDSQEQTSQYA